MLGKKKQVHAKLGRPASAMKWNAEKKRYEFEDDDSEDDKPAAAPPPMVKKTEDTDKKPEVKEEKKEEASGVNALLQPGFMGA